MKKFFFDTVYGGAYDAVTGNGTVSDSTKELIFQSNVILFLAGLNSAQAPDPSITPYANSVAGFLLNHLAWAPDGPGTWYALSSRTGANAEPGGWLSPSEVYPSYALLWMYKMTGNSTYLDAARINLNYQMTHFPDGHVLRGDNLDVNYRSPERMSYYTIWQITGNQSYLDYLKKFQTATTGKVGWENADRNGTIVTLYIHGNTALDLADYILASGDKSSLDEARSLVANYAIQGHTDYSRGSDQGKDYYQKLLAMDLAMWTVTGETNYQTDAIRAYKQFVRFWDSSPPYGFWSSLEKVTKTCFSRGYPSGVDMTPPVIETKSVDPNRITARITDPSYQWLGINYTGVGVNANSVFLFYAIDGKSWLLLNMAPLGNNTYTASLPAIVQRPGHNVQYMISASDYFNNTSTLPAAPALEVVTTSGILPVTTDFSWLPLFIVILGAALAVWVGYRYADEKTPPTAAAQVRCVLPCRYWNLCQHRHFPICSTSGRYPIDDGRYYCHNCIARGFDWWYQNYGLYQKTVDVFDDNRTA